MKTYTLNNEKKAIKALNIDDLDKVTGGTGLLDKYIIECISDEDLNTAG